MSKELHEYQDVYTDASIRNTNHGWAVYYGEDDPRNRSGQAGLHLKIHELEMFAVGKAVMQALTEASPLRNFKRLRVWTDSMSVIYNLHGYAILASFIGPLAQGCALAVYRDIQTLNGIYKKAGCGSGVQIRKVKSHSGVPGNEAADRMAYKAAGHVDRERVFDFFGSLSL